MRSLVSQPHAVVVGLFLLVHTQHSLSFNLVKTRLSVGRNTDGVIDHDFADDHPNVMSIPACHGPFSPDLLTNYWGRSPLLIRSAFHAEALTEVWPSQADLLELALDDDEISSDSARIITHTSGRLDSFASQLGPFSTSTIQGLEHGDKMWTLIVNDMDRYVSTLADWMDDEFGFLPRWRRDDAQISMARTGGGIGPHVDSYDVFLIQTSGQRTWLVGNTMTVQEEMNTLIPDLSVRILRDVSNHNESSHAYTRLELQPGDVLYLPPRYVHWGTALTDDCVTLSVGARSPSSAELVARIAETMLGSVSVHAVQRYTDPDLLQEVNGAPLHSMTNHAKDSMKTMVLDAVHEITDDPMRWDEVVGKLATEPKRMSENALVPYNEIKDSEYLAIWGGTPRDALARIREGRGALYRIEGVSFATSRVEYDGVITERLFAHGSMWEICDDELATAVLCRIEKGKPITISHIEGLSAPLAELLTNLISEGILYASEDLS